MPAAFEQMIQVGVGDIDQLGHVNNVTYVRWVQDVAVAHWKAAASEADQKSVFWVVLRHEIDYKQPALLDEMVTVRTWVGQAIGLRFERHTEFLRALDGKLFAKARTVWCPINPSTGRPVEVSNEVRSIFSS